MAALHRSHRDSYDIGHFAANGRPAVSWPLVAALAVAGLAIGWSLRAVVVRLAVPAGEPARTFRPPPLAVEVSTAVLLGVLAAWVHPGLVLAAACWLAVCTIPLAWIDAAVQRLPDVLTAPAYAGTSGLLLLAAVIGGLALAAAYLALAIVSRSAIGLGDAKLAASLGTMLAWAGWSVLVAGLLAGFLLAAVYGLGLPARRRTSWRQRIPFGPFMIAGAFLALVITAGTVS